MRRSQIRLGDGWRVISTVLARRAGIAFGAGGASVPFRSLWPLVAGVALWPYWSSLAHCPSGARIALVPLGARGSYRSGVAFGSRRANRAGIALIAFGSLRPCCAGCGHLDVAVIVRCSAVYSLHCTHVSRR